MKRRNTQSCSPSSLLEPSRGTSLQPTAASRVFNVKELMLMIFEWFDPFIKEGHNDLLSYMLTCKAWRDPACMALWRVATCPKLLRLMPISLPLPDQNTNPYTWAQSLRPQHYASFKRYAPFIVHLKHNDRETAPMFASWVEAFLSNARDVLDTTDHILPKLSSIYWHRTIVSAFATENVNLSLAPLIATRLTEFVGRVVTSGVRSLDIDFPVPPIVELLLPIIATLPKLEHLGLPLIPFQRSLGLFDRISELKYLRSFSNVESLCHSSSDVTHGVDADIILRPGLFSHLDTLELQCHPQTVINFLSQANSPVAITRLAVRIPYATASHGMLELLTIVAQRCTKLKGVKIDCDPRTSPFNSLGESIGPEVLRPLFSLTRMESFEIACMRKLNLPQTFFEDLSCAWPNLKCLHLESTPMEDSEEPEVATMDALVPLAEKCTKIRTISLSVDPKSGSVLQNWCILTTPLPTFFCLETLTLHLGGHKCDKAFTAALPLHRMIRNGFRCNLSFLSFFDHPGWPAYRQRVVEERRIGTLIRLEKRQKDEFRHLQECFGVLFEANFILMSELSREIRLRPQASALDLFETLSSRVMSEAQPQAQLDQTAPEAEPVNQPVQPPPVPESVPEPELTNQTEPGSEVGFEQPHEEVVTWSSLLVDGLRTLIWPLL